MKLMANVDDVPDVVGSANLKAVAEHLSALVVAEVPCDPAPEAIATWIAREIEAGYTRVYAINAESCIGPQCAPYIIAELKLRNVATEDLAVVSEVLFSRTGVRDVMRDSILASLLRNALYAATDATLRQVMTTANEGGIAHARCVRMGHESIILFDHHTKLDWLYAGAKHKVRDALARVGCDPRAALTQEIDLSRGGKLSVPGYELVVSRGRGGVRTRVCGQGAETIGPLPIKKEVIEEDKKNKPVEDVVWRWPPFGFGFVGRVAHVALSPVRALQNVELNAATVSALARAIVGYVRTRATGAALVACMIAAFACLGVVAIDVYKNISGETRAPNRPQGFYVGQYNKAGPWGKDLLPYGLYIPPQFRGQRGPFPLIVYLHGYGERSPRQLFAAGLPMSIASRFGEGTKNGPFDFIALFPNDPTGYWEATSQEGKDAIEVLDYVMARHNIDPDRVYLTGASSGGAGVWRYAEVYPDRWAAVAPLGAVHTPAPVVVKNIPTWIFHGERDETAPIGLQRVLLRRLKEIGCDAKLTEFPGKAHTVSSETYDNRELFTWFSTKKR